MPYLAIKTLPKDEETKKRAVERLYQVLLEEWDCPASAISISIEDITLEEYKEKIMKEEYVAKKDAMYILNGEKQF